ncbi:MAG: hypothetical protein IVW55_10255 [Chloroflexi bacterium]|nr:hypothetical protein [Chloroflexota bacterium]
MHIRTIQNASVAVGWAGHRTLTIDRETQAGGMGLGFNGAEMLDLITSTDCIAEIPNSLRRGTPVRLRDAQAIPVEK